MHQTSLDFLNAVTPPAGADTAPETDALYAQMMALHDVIADIQDRLNQVRRLHAKADAMEPDPKIFWHFEQFVQTFGAIEREAALLRQTAKALTDATYQLDSLGVGIWERLGLERPA